MYPKLWVAFIAQRLPFIWNSLTLIPLQLPHSYIRLFLITWRGEHGEAGMAQGPQEAALGAVVTEC